jgi:hypothetical protein
MSIARLFGGTILGCALLVTTRAHAADVSINDEARKYFQAGVSFLQDPDGARYEDAYREFEAAYAASPSPKILGNIGYCAFKLERDGEAITAYTRYLQEVPDVDPAEAAQISRDLATLRAGLVRVTLTVDVPGASVIDKRLPARGESISNLYGPVSARIDMGLRPGHHIIALKAHGETLQPWEFDAKPGATLSQAFVLKPAAERAHGSSSLVLPWIVTSVGGAALIGGGIVGAITLGKVSTIASNCPNNQCPATYALQPAQDDARRFVRTTDVLLIGGGVVAATGLWLFVAMGGSSAPRPPSSAARATFAPPSLACSPSGCSAAMSGAF